MFTTTNNLTKPKDGTAISVAEKSLSKAKVYLLLIVTILNIVFIGIYFWHDEVFTTCTLKCSTLITSLIPNLVATGIAFIAAYFFAQKIQNLQNQKTNIERNEALKHHIKENVHEALTKHQLELERKAEASELISLETISHHLLEKYREIQDADEDLMGVLSLKYNYDDTNWEELLRNAKSVEFCMYYASPYWFRKNGEALQTLLKQGGKITVYLPNITGIKDRFRLSSTFDKAVQSKITLAEGLFRDLATNDDEHSRLTIKFSKQGFNYFLARITSGEGSLIAISPYSNNHEKTDSPTLLLDMERASPALKRFIEAEFRLLQKGEQLPSPSREKLLMWSNDFKKAFLSTKLECPAQCSFCYVESLVQPKNTDLSSEHLAAAVLRELLNSSRFRAGPQGTTILLGGFTDPFVPQNIAGTSYLTEQLSSRGNWIHIATRYTIAAEFIATTIPQNRNIVINYSISSLSHRGIEISNQTQRFNQAKSLVSAGFHVSLFLRPILPSITEQDLDGIMELAKFANIKTVTLGGLYVDNRIQQSLKQRGYQILNPDRVSKHFVLDTEGVLEKIENSEILSIKKKLIANGFVVFDNADERIEFYKNQPHETT